VPPGVIGSSATTSADVLWTTLRLAALEAFTLVFVSIVTGSFRLLFVRLMKAQTVHRLHSTTALLGLSIAVVHGVLAAVFGIAGYKAAPLWLGPTALVLLVVAILAALSRRTLRRSWRWIHRLNYGVFTLGFVHGALIGYDVPATLFLRVCFWVYAAVVVAGLAFRLVDTHRRGPAETRGAGGDRRRP